MTANLITYTRHCASSHTHMYRQTHLTCTTKHTPIPAHSQNVRNTRTRREMKNYNYIYLCEESKTCQPSQINVF